VARRDPHGGDEAWGSGRGLKPASGLPALALSMFSGAGSEDGEAA